MADHRLRIVAGPPLRAALRATGGSEYPTGRLNALAERYLAIIEEARPALHRSEWLAICDANNGYGPMEEIQSESERGGSANWQIVWANVADAQGLGDKWQIDQQALVEKLRALTAAQKIAVAETIQRFWALPEMPASAALDLAASHPATWPPDKGATEQ